MENKFYTPNLEEFCLGFEYDFLQHHGSPEQEWVSLILSQISDGEDDPYLGLTFKALENYDNVFIRNAWRVKYLSQSDIESFGFEFVDYNKMGQMTTYQKVWDSGKGIFRSKLITYSKDVNNEKEEVLIKLHDIVRFHGYIRNKSELNRILKQLNIIE